MPKYFLTTLEKNAPLKNIVYMYVRVCVRARAKTSKSLFAQNKICTTQIEIAASKT